MDNNALNFKINAAFYDIHINKKQFMNRKDSSRKWVMFIVENGSFYFKINQESGVAKAGDIVICPPNTDFHREVISTLSMHYCSFTWTPIAIEKKKKIKEPIFSKYILTSKHVNELLKIYTSIRYIHSKPTHSRMVWITHLLNDVWFHYCVKEPLNIKQETAKPEDPLMKQIKLYLKNNAFTNIKIQAVAKEFYMDPSQLSNKFKTTYGMTPIEYIQKIRLDKVKLLLIQTDRTIQEIATLCGYENGFYLSRVFKKFMGIAPSEYRKSHII